MLKYILLSHILTVALFAAQPIAQFGRAGMGGVIGNPRSSILVGSEIFVEVSLMHERPSELDSILQLAQAIEITLQFSKEDLADRTSIPLTLGDLEMYSVVPGPLNPGREGSLPTWYFRGRAPEALAGSYVSLLAVARFPDGTRRASLRHGMNFQQAASFADSSRVSGSRVLVAYEFEPAERVIALAEHMIAQGWKDRDAFLKAAAAAKSIGKSEQAARFETLARGMPEPRPPLPWCGMP